MGRGRAFGTGELGSELAELVGEEGRVDARRPVEDRSAAGRRSPGHVRGCVRLMGGDPPLARSLLALLCVVLCFITPPRAH